ncbi:MAG: S8 family serine peptidase [Sedimentisphaerales bacterium]|nr:S8 family serine peptidase [Sedimentisphaerales bacterium]
MIQKSRLSVATLWIAAWLIGSVAIAGRATAQSGSVLQPQALNWAGITALRSLDSSLTGAGVRIGIVCRSFTQNDEPQYDYRPNTNHSCFQNTKFHFYDDGEVAAGVSPHETAICSILFGEDPLGIAANLEPFWYQGAVPAAEGHIFELRHFITQYVHGQVRPLVDLVAASFGTAFDGWWTRGMESMAEHEGLTVIASIGNGTNASEPPLYPGAGSNTIGVGVISSVNAEDPATNLAYFALAYPEQSSRGPTDDGRCKPDLIAPGNCLVAGAQSDHGYTASGNWSSYSTPVVAGAAGLLIQAARQEGRLDAILSPGGGNCLLKAVLMTSAAKLPFWHKGRLTGDDDHEMPLDYAQGAGMVDAVRARQLLMAGRGNPGNVALAGWDLNQLDGSQVLQQVYRITLDESVNKMLTVTLVWNRHYQKEYPFERLSHRDTDLRLEVRAVNPQDASESVLLDHSDSKLDNVEHVHVETVAGYSSYAIVVTYSNPGERALPGEQYGLAWSVEDKPEADKNILWADLNADGIVNEQDLEILMNNLVAGQKSPEAYVIGDINMDGSIDVDDVKVLYAHLHRKADWHIGGVTN